jgi:4-amino-4-deoxy-L-arabinose transferase-like glycosyltransferase
MANPNPAGPPPHAWEWKVILWLCLLAAIHGYIFSAAFPFFNNVDEPTHFDLVVKYARGDVPRRMELYTDESVKYYVLYGSPFYMSTDTNDQEFIPQPWKYPPETRDALIRIGKPAFVQTNYESSQPPLYYALAGAWWRASGGLKLDGGTRLYGLRFLNIPIICLLVWLGWYTARQVFPNNIFPRIGVPAFIAFMPQSAFYSIQNDTLSSLCFGVAFVCLLRLFQTEIPSWRLGALTGLALAATFLTKMTNVPLLAVSIMALAALTWRWWREGKLRKALPALSILTACAALPALAWIDWCRTHFGDFTGSQPKVLYWGWTPKPVSEWLQHPIFTFHGAGIFVSGLLSAFWQGEITWYKQPLCRPAVSWFYEFATIILLLVTLAKIIRRPAPLFQTECRALRFSFFLFAASVAFLVFISIRFDFHNCTYPSRAFPYLISGRLMLGALIPSMLLFVSGLDRILQRFKLPTKFLILAALNLAMLIAEFVTDQPAFFDKYNWYHM